MTKTKRAKIRRKNKPIEGGVGGQSHQRMKTEYPTPPKSPTTKLALSALHYASHIRTHLLPLGRQMLHLEILHTLLEAEEQTLHAIQMLESHVKFDHRKEAVEELQTRLGLIQEGISKLMEEFK